MPHGPDPAGEKTDACGRCLEIGPAACAAERVAFRREPWLPGGFEIGAQWTSHDSGLTWTRYPVAERAWRGGMTMTVTAIDEKTGTVTIKVGGKI